MSTKQTGRDTSKIALADYLPEPLEIKADGSEFAPDEPDNSIDNDEATLPENGIGSENDLQTTPTVPSELTESPATIPQTVQTAPRRTSGRQRKESLEEYRQTFLSVPRLEDRKPVFVSREVRDRLDEIARKLGDRRTSVSGFIENMARHHLSTYHEDIEVWRKL